jgi:hypothetical protein
VLPQLGARLGAVSLLGIGGGALPFGRDNGRWHPGAAQEAVQCSALRVAVCTNFDGYSSGASITCTFAGDIDVAN